MSLRPFADKQVLIDIIKEAKLMQEERKKITSLNLALVLVHDILLSSGIQARDGPIKQAILRHKTRLHGEFQRIKIKRGAISNAELAESGDSRTGLSQHFDNDCLYTWILPIPRSTNTSLCSCQHGCLVYR